MTLLSDLPVRRKLAYAMLLTSSLALLVACGVFLAVEYADYRRSLVQTVATLARITADNSTASVAFSDATAARQTLEALRAEPQIIDAVLYDNDGKVVARYLVTGQSGRPPAPRLAGGVRFENGEVVAIQPVVENARRVGTLYLRATQEVMFTRMRAWAWVAFGILALSTVLAAVIAHVLGRTLARPILELDRTAGAVAAGQDYSLRARQYGQDELGRLTAAFNGMLATTEKSVGALRESEQRFRVLADHAPVLIWLTDAHRHFVWVNQRWLEFTGRPIAAEVGQGWTENLHPEDRGRTLRQIGEAFLNRRNFQVEYRLRRHDGVYCWMLSHGLPRSDAMGGFTGFIGSCIDVSDRKLAEQEIMEARDKALAASRSKDNFLAALSHELRTPLTPVLLLASEESINPRLPPAVRADFEMIAKNIALEARLIDDLLDLTRITRGKLVLDLQPADAHAILRDALATVEPDFAERKIELHVELAAPRHHLMGDPIRLQQVFWNVLKNAAKFTSPCGRVTVQTSVVDHHNLLVRVTDSGIGMTPDELSRVFEAFAQGDHVGTAAGHQFGGLGLGLAISERMVQLHGGTIRASSAGRNLGAQFEIELPLDAPLPQGSNPQRPSAAAR
ncbi:MAG: multi-sensor hybrid histidine kinase [Lacunisphaera sp.]|nr:multi-sensor hybrid histidine kinase [Lacunisphaera sp.]